MDVFYNILSKNVLQYLNEEIQPILSGVKNKKSPKARPSKAKSFCDVISLTLNLTGVTHKSRCSSLRSAASSYLIRI